jgi:hypothetical protein
VVAFLVSTTVYIVAKILKAEWNSNLKIKWEILASNGGLLE